MKKPNRVPPLMSEAFVFWLSNLGYKGVSTIGGIKFYHPVVNKNFPRDVMILNNGRLNKPATKLFEEFKSYEPFGEVV